MRSKSGFTLIELLVVIAIIGLLASVIMASLNNARAKARDARRLADLRQLQTALELYASDNNGGYPSTGGSSSWHGNCSTYGSFGTTGATGWIPNLAPSYISSLPLDPKPISTDKCYLYTSDGIDFMLLAHKTTETFTPATNPAPRPIVPGDSSLAFYTPGARTW